jgi:hypothetical protein
VIELHHLDLQGLDRWCKINPNLLTTRHPIGSEERRQGASRRTRPELWPSWFETRRFATLLTMRG